MLKRGRPKIARIVRIQAKTRQFSPRGKPGRPDEVDIGMDHLEALKLADLQGWPQKEAASLMNVSQQTFSRILNKARKLIADAVVNGKSIRILPEEKYIKSDPKNII